MSKYIYSWYEPSMASHRVWLNAKARYWKLFLVAGVISVILTLRLHKNIQFAFICILITFLLIVAISWIMSFFPRTILIYDDGIVSMCGRLRTKYPLKNIEQISFNLTVRDPNFVIKDKSGKISMFYLSPECETERVVRYFRESNVDIKEP